MKKNKALIKLYNLIYNDGQLLKNILSIKKINSLDNYYKNNFDRYENYNDFYNNMGSLKEYLEMSFSAKAEFEKQFKINKGLQPSIVNECFVVQTIANALNLENFMDIDAKPDEVPSELMLYAITFTGKTGKARPRYLFYNNKQNVILFQYGDSSSIDALFVSDKNSIRIEIKSESSKLSEIDIPRYNEKGFLELDERFKNKYPEYIELINQFNKDTNMIEFIGHNYKLKDHLDDKTLKNIVEAVFETKDMDLFILQKADSLFPVIPADLMRNVDIGTSEIRTAGRNAKKVFTPLYLQTVLDELGGKIVDDKIRLPLIKEKLSDGRQTKKVSRYKLNNYFFLYINKIKIEEDFVLFKITDVKQLKPTISIHLTAEPNMEVLDKRKNLLNKKYFF